MRRIISTEKAPRAVGPYSQAVKANGLLFVSGQIPIDPNTNEMVEESIDIQTRQVLQNLGAILDKCGLTFDDVIKTTVFITDMKNFGSMNEVYAEFFTSFPARSTVEVSSLPKGALVEIEAIAATG